MIPDIQLKFQGGYLRPLTPEDVTEAYMDGINDPEVNKYLVAVKQEKQSIDTLKSFIESNAQAADAVFFGVWNDQSGALVGTVRLHGIEYTHQTAHIGICLFDKSVWGKGLGSKAISVVTKWCFSNLRLRWIEAGTYQENHGSRNSFMKAGYVVVAEIPDKYLLDGKAAPVSILAARNFI